MRCPRIDHLVYACGDLEQGIRSISDQLGVRAVPGGRHPAWRTHNALIGLGGSSYLEIIAPDPDAPPGRGSTPDVFFREEEAGLTTWAAAVENLQSSDSRLRDSCSGLGPLIEGSRMTSDGTPLSWVLTDPAATVLDGAIPFLIDWGDSRHPSRLLPDECSLSSILIHHPLVDQVSQVLESLGLLDLVEIRRATEFRLTASIRSPRGLIRI